MSRYKPVLFNIIFLMLFQGNIKAENENPDFDISQKGSFELGGVIGTPSGLNAKFWFTEKIALDSSFGINLEKDPVLTFNILIEEYILHKTYSWESRFFYGFGSLLAKEDNEWKNNIRIPAGLSFPSIKYPITFSFFIAPALVLKPEKKFDFNWGIGLSYNFGRASAITTNMERKVEKLESDVNNLKHGLNTAKGKLAETEGELGSTKGKLAETEGELGSTKGKLAETEVELGATKGKLDKLKVKLDGIKESLDKTEGELDSTKNKLFKTTRELDSSKNQLDEVRNELTNTKKILDDKQVELNKKKVELDNMGIIISNAFTGKEKQEEEKKLAEKQNELNKQVSELSENKKSWERIKKNESNKRDLLRENCEKKGGIINDDGYCTCPENEEWDPDTDKCECLKGYKKNSTTGNCEPCEIIKYNGKCADVGCDDDEEKVKLKKGPHKYVCIKRCRGKNEVWSNRKKTCGCKEGYYRNDVGECVPRS